MSEQFLFFCTNIGNEKFLKEEIRVFYPDLSLSYSRKGFITFKNKGILYDIETISQLEVTFATRVGICLGKANPAALLELVEKSLEEWRIDLGKCIVHNFSINTNYCFEASKVFKRVVNEYSPINKTVLDVMSLGDKEIWYGVHKVGKNTTYYPNSKTAIIVPELSPSRAYLKIAETVELFNVKFDKLDSWLDFGSAPGGASYFLLNRGCKVWGIDPAPVSGIVTDHPDYSHFFSPVQDLSQEELPDRDISWVHADLNLNPKQSIKEVLRLCKKYNFTLKGIILTIPVIKMDHVKNIENFEDHFHEWGFSNVIGRQIPSHKQEYVIIAKR